MPERDIILIDEDKCNGCGQCVVACDEGALEIIDGKAKLVADIFCDGLGACIGECPEGALTIIKKDTVEFDEAAVEEHLSKLKKDDGAKKPELKMACGCPSTQEAVFSPAPIAPGSGKAASSLGHWPIKLRLVNPSMPFLKGSDFVLLADCAATAYPGLHQDILPGKAVVMGCPKFDELDQYIEKLTEILKVAKPASFTVVYMEVPCCLGFVHAAKKAVEQAETGIKLKTMLIARDGKILE